MIETERAEQAGSVGWADHSTHQRIVERDVVFCGGGTVNEEEVILRDLQLTLARQGLNVENGVVFAQFQTGTAQAVG